MKKQQHVPMIFTGLDKYDIFMGICEIFNTRKNIAS